MLENNNNFALKQTGITFFSNCAGFFNFLIYLYLAEVIIATFFPVSDGVIIAKLLVLSVFSAGYLARPIGGLLLGRFGDIKGRKPVFIISASIIAISSLLTALLPTYQQVGLLAPILFVIARIIQGMAFGVQSPLGWVYIAEHVPKSQTAFYASLFTISFPVTILVVMLFFNALFNSFTHNELIDYAWRIPFIVSAILNSISIALGYFFQETPSFKNSQLEQRFLPRYDDLTLAVKRYNAIFLSTLLGFFSSSLMFFIMVLLPILIPIRFQVDSQILKFANGLGIIFLGIGYLFFGLMADRGHIGKSLMIGSIALAIQAFALFYLLENSTGGYLLFMYALLGFFSGVASLGPVIILQLFFTRVRLTALSLAFNATFAVVGGVLPFVLIYFTRLISFSPALYMIFIGFIGFILGLYFHNSPKLNALANQK